MTRGAAFIDLDRTLADLNTGLLYARHEFKVGRISARQLAMAVIWSTLYHFNLLDMETAFEKAIQHYAGMPDAELESATNAWFLDAVKHRKRPGAEARIKAHRDRGEPVVLLTNSSMYMARAATDAWALDHGIGNVFPTNPEGLLVGTISRPLCYGAGKIHYAQRWADDNDVSLEDSTFYTDSASDIPMLEAVAHPVVVHPDPKLRRIARARNWPIEMW